MCKTLQMAEAWTQTGQTLDTDRRSMEERAFVKIDGTGSPERFLDVLAEMIAKEMAMEAMQAGN